jgi:hypothetical protein
MEREVWGVYYRMGGKDYLWCEQPAFKYALMAANALNGTLLVRTYGLFKVKRVNIA